MAKYNFNSIIMIMKGGDIVGPFNMNYKARYWAIQKLGVDEAYKLCLIDTNDLSEPLRSQVLEAVNITP